MVRIFVNRTHTIHVTSDMIKNLKNDGAECSFEINWNNYNIKIDNLYESGNIIEAYSTTIQINGNGSIQDIKLVNIEFETNEEFSLSIDKNSIRYDKNLIRFESDEYDGDELLIRNLHVECTFPIKETFDEGTCS
ncbi:hypothetical protein RF11_07713 [Thelohanellus kitauei]|uniref:Uncharacterized protein n=1 Tax=Thelohanellus kitauei TaxID=669202 RepID=A0A0C2MSU3_THEKT|nr:hypothetical protein RF11_07713 [Thelohanellus kitauei]